MHRFDTTPVCDRRMDRRTDMPIIVITVLCLHELLPTLKAYNRVRPKGHSFELPT